MTQQHARLAVRSLSSVALVLLAVLAWPLGRSVPRPSPEDVGMSSERLHRINDLVQRHIDARSFSGAVTLVARNGRVAHLEAQGLMDIESKKPMQKDTIFRIMSMTKPVVGTAILMLRRKARSDHRSDLRVHPRVQRTEGRGCAARPGAGRGAGAAPQPRFYTVPADREITFAIC